MPRACACADEVRIGEDESSSMVYLPPQFLGGGAPSPEPELPAPNGGARRSAGGLALADEPLRAAASARIPLPPPASASGEAAAAAAVAYGDDEAAGLSSFEAPSFERHQQELQRLATYDAHGPSRALLIPPLRMLFTRAGIEWRLCHHAVCVARSYEEPHHSGQPGP